MKKVWKFLRIRMMLLSNKVAVVTGAGGGIGKEITQLFIANGATVYAIDKNIDSLKDLNCIPVAMDITDTSLVRVLFTRIKKEQNQLDILVNNAGVMLDAVIGMISKEQIQKTYAVNVFAVIDFIQYGVRFFKKQFSGSIINLASIMGTNGDANKMLYCSSKGAIIAMTKAAAKELAPYKIRVNAISPGTVNTELLKGVSDELMQKTISSIKMGFIAEPREIAQLALFLASDNSSYITGQTIGIDGSMII